MAPTMGRLYQHQQQQHQQQWAEPVPVPYRLRQPMLSSGAPGLISAPGGQNQTASASSSSQVASPMAFANQQPMANGRLPNDKHQTQQQLQEYLQRLQSTGRVPAPRPPAWPLATMASGANIGSSGARLVCDIDQVYPMPEVSIYRLGKANGAHPEPSLLKLDTRVERVRSMAPSPASNLAGAGNLKGQITPSGGAAAGAYHVQVTSFVDDDELIARYGQGPSYFECLITLPNLESTRYDSKRTIVYTPGKLFQICQLL